MQMGWNIDSLYSFHNPGENWEQWWGDGKRQREKQTQDEKRWPLKFPRANSVPIHKLRVPAERQNVPGM